MQKIIPNLWFDRNAEEAVKYYTSLFNNSGIGSTSRYGKAGFEFHKMPEGTVMTMEFSLEGQQFIALNAGPVFTFNPSISFFVMCETETETDKLWKSLAEGGKVLMPLDKYDWSEKYGWVQDRFGINWQIAFGKLQDVGQKISTALLFTNKQHGKAEEAVHFYTSVIKNSSIMGILKYDAGEPEPAGTVKHAQFSLAGQTFMIMESAAAHNFNFNEAISLVISCQNQEEVDYYWEKLTAGGEEAPCGWLKDKFGISWQVVPVQLAKMMKDPDRKKAGKVMDAFLKMKKYDIKKLEEAYNS